MRGTPVCSTCTPRNTGIIHAYAGNTHFIVFITVARRDHPRICGEHRLGPHHPVTRPGSSPHMRGTHHVREEVAAAAGIIPAYAGNTEVHFVSFLVSGDHPRICGEHGDYADYAIRNKGSSPHMRGTPIWDNQLRCTMGIIPAYAGNTRFYFPLRILKRDHPRICGEHFNAVRNATSPQGSSPHMRGTPLETHLNRIEGGIIPAYAGNTTAQYSVGRVAGGSSPHMRGTPYHVRRTGGRRGIIPAYAGNTSAQVHT